MAINWEDDESMPLGPMTMESVKFIKSSERFPDINFGRIHYNIVDMGTPLHCLSDDTNGTLFYVTSTLPGPVDFKDIDWLTVAKIILDCIVNVMDTIIETSTGPAALQCWLQLVATGESEQVDASIATAGVCKEFIGWTKSARSSYLGLGILFHFARMLKVVDNPGDIYVLWELYMGLQLRKNVMTDQIMPTYLLSALYGEACNPVRGTEEVDMAFSVSDNMWSKPNCLKQVCNWVLEMDEVTFMRGCCIESFRKAAKEWTASAVERIEDWLTKAITSMDCSHLQKYKCYRNSDCFLKTPKPKPIIKMPPALNDTIILGPDSKELDINMQEVKLTHQASPKTPHLSVSEALIDAVIMVESPRRKCAALQAVLDPVRATPLDTVFVQFVNFIALERCESKWTKLPTEITPLEKVPKEANTQQV
ncbi:hypothetical protein M422DRAFT_53848 [Sphaerobolus stellatus SS14]|uniref:Uncharacterized protein n=1 Tax=Sphaerobolus stellatus (strain SS14) TaxID=990650 RepID=A0A0C9UN22_SPHS4|nr:hypothetical protein M422DRAFT_53848 [Sphaerobolus stellatus SS14]